MEEFRRNLMAAVKALLFTIIRQMPTPGEALGVAGQAAGRGYTP